MRKGLLTLCAFLLTATAASAQGLQFKRFSVDNASVTPVAAKVNKAAKAASDYSQWGYVDAETPLGNWITVGVSGATAKLSAAYFVDGSGKLKGSKLAAIDVPSADDNTTGVKVWVKSSLDGEDIASKAYSGTIAAGTFQQVVLDTPIDIPEEGFYVGYTATTKYIVCAGSEAIPNSLYLRIDESQQPTWGDYHTNGWGSLLMQLELTDIKLPDYASALFGNISTQRTEKGAAGQFTVKVQNEGGVPINSIDYTVDVDGVKTAKHADFGTPIPAGLKNSTGTLTVDFTSPAEIKSYDIKLNIDKVNGGDNHDKADVKTATFTNVLRKVARRTVVEEQTGTGCGWCPRGYAAMETMKEKYPDTFIGVVSHTFNSTDPMYVGTDYPGYLGSAPLAYIDRGDMIDPYFGSGMHEDITGDFEAANKLLPVADVSVSGGISPDGKTVDVTGSVEYLAADQDLSLAYVLLADSLTGTTTAWKQSNYYKYYNYTPAQAGVTENIPLLKEFCSGGKWFLSSVTLVYNDVEIASSYKSGKNLAPALTGDNTPGAKAETSYTLTLPTKAVLLTAIKARNYGDLFVVALAIDNKTGEIVNAASSKVTGTEAGVVSVNNGTDSAKEVSRYTVGGQKVNAPVKGVNIIKMSDGTTRKVVVE